MRHGTPAVRGDRGGTFACAPAGLGSARLRSLFPAAVLCAVLGVAGLNAGTADAQTLHRIDEAFVIAEIERAGFRLQAVGDFMRNPDDKRDWNASLRTAGERRGTSDRFALQFVKPR